MTRSGLVLRESMARALERRQRTARAIETGILHVYVVVRITYLIIF